MRTNVKGTSFQGVVDPAHPIARRIGHLCRVADDPIATVTAEMTGLRWVSRKGAEPYDSVLQNGEGGCLSLAALACAALTAGGVENCRVLVAAGGLLFSSLVVTNAPRYDRLTGHAWVLAPDRGSSVLIDPITMRRRTVRSGRSLARAMRVRVPVEYIVLTLFDHVSVSIFQGPEACDNVLGHAVAVA